MSAKKSDDKTGVVSIDTFPRHQDKALACLGPPPLIEGEDVNAYRQLLAMVIDLVKPADIIDWIHVHDVADLQWEVGRFRRAKAQHISDAAERSFQLKYIHTEDELPQKMPPQPLINSCAAASIDRTERIDRIVMTMEARRDKAYREIERRQSSRAARAGRRTEEIEDAEFQVIDHPNPGELAG